MIDKNLGAIYSLGIISLCIVLYMLFKNNRSVKAEDIKLEPEPVPPKVIPFPVSVTVGTSNVIYKDPIKKYRLALTVYFSGGESGIIYEPDTKETVDTTLAELNDEEGYIGQYRSYLDKKEGYDYLEIVYSNGDINIVKMSEITCIKTNIMEVTQNVKQP